MEWALLQKKLKIILAVIDSEVQNALFFSRQDVIVDKNGRTCCFWLPLIGWDHFVVLWQQILAIQVS